MADALLDTSVVIDLARLARTSPDAIPEAATVSTLTMAELVQGPELAGDAVTRRRRERALSDAREAFPSPLPFDENCVGAYRSVVAITVDAGRRSRRRTVDLLIAATAHAHGMDLWTRNPDDVAHLASILTVVEI